MPRILGQVVDALNKLEPLVREEHKEVSQAALPLCLQNYSCYCRLGWRN